EDQVVTALSKVSEPVDLLINNAGRMKRANYWELSESDFEAVWGVDVKGIWLMFKHLRGKLAQGAMTVQTNSKNALQVKANTFAYTLSKLADLSIDEIVVKDRPDLDMRVAHLGPVDTPLEWTDYSAEQKAEKMKIVITPTEAAKLMMDLIRSDKKKLIYKVDECKYELQ
ncbi:SDR family oxidoreductase, partial [Candidatus Peregrinibacteria bacterium]|nr:SDR family oxidoreductase [Candidatus Peregrinibacteria bacterium]